MVLFKLYFTSKFVCFFLQSSRVMLINKLCTLLETHTNHSWITLRQLPVVSSHSNTHKQPQNTTSPPHQQIHTLCIHNRVHAYTIEIETKTNNTKVTKYLKSERTAPVQDHRISSKQSAPMSTNRWKHFSVYTPIVYGDLEYKGIAWILL